MKLSRWFLFTFSVAILASAGCGVLSPKQEGKVATAGIDIALCVLAHSNEPIASIIGECGAESEQQVLNIFAAAQKANARGFSRPVTDAGP